jgi:hypothetical protein
MSFERLNEDQIIEKYGIVDPWDYVTSFENAIKEYCGYGFAIACDSNTNAIKLCLEYLGIKNEKIRIPAKTYVSVPNQIIHSGNYPELVGMEWYGEYEIGETGIIDSACKFEKNSAISHQDPHYKILSFHHRKIINIGKGGMILTNDAEFEGWARTMIYDGRHKEVKYDNDEFDCYGYHMYMTPEDAKKGLSILHSDRIGEDVIMCASHEDYKDLRNQNIFNKKVLATHNFDIWDSYYYESKMIQDIIKSPKKYFNIILPQEYIIYYHKRNHLDYFIELDNDLKMCDKYLTYYCGSEFDEEINKRCDNIKVVTWDSVDYFAKSQPYRFPSLMFYGKHHKEATFELLKTIIPSRHFSIMTFIKAGREWRGYIAEKLYETKLNEKTNLCLRVDSSIRSYNESSFSYTDKKGGVLRFHPLYWNKNIDLNYKSDPSIEFNISKTPVEYMMGSFDIAVETITDYFFVTEKTLRPIMSEKPFMVFSCQNYHKKLSEKYGFKLYDELIDYSFDSIPELDKRFDAQINELVRISNKYTAEEIFHLTRETTSFNFSILEKLRNTKFVNIPREIYQTKLINEYKYLPNTLND